MSFFFLFHFSCRSNYYNFTSNQIGIKYICFIFQLLLFNVKNSISAQLLKYSQIFISTRNVTLKIIIMLYLSYRPSIRINQTFILARSFFLRKLYYYSYALKGKIRFSVYPSYAPTRLIIWAGIIMISLRPKLID